MVVVCQNWPTFRILSSKTTALADCHKIAYFTENEGKEVREALRCVLFLTLLKKQVVLNKICTEIRISVGSFPVL